MKEFFKNKVIPFVTRVADHHYVKAIQSGMMGIVGITIFSGVATLLKSPPFPANSTNAFALAWFDFAANNAGWLEVLYQSTTNIMALLALIGIIYALCKHYKRDPLNPIIVGLVSFIIVSVNLVTVQGPYGVSYNFDITYFGAQGLFAAIIISIVVVELLKFIEEKNIKIKMPESVPPMVSKPFEAMISNAITLIVFIGIRIIFSQFNLLFPQIALIVFSPLLTASENFFVVVLLFMFSRVLWFFGIHGTSIIFAVLMPIMAMNTVANLEAFNANQAIPHVLTSSFILWQIGMLPAAIAMLLVCKSAQLKATARLGIVPSLFMISEPILFGTPFVFNPILFIPHILAFGWSVGAAFLAMSSGLVAKPVFSAPGQVPGFIGAFLTTLDWKAVVLWFVIVAVAVLIYIPFLKQYDKKLLIQEASSTPNE